MAQATNDTYLGEYKHPYDMNAIRQEAIHVVAACGIEEIDCVRHMALPSNKQLTLGTGEYNGK